MNGLIFKTVSISFFSILLIPALVFATPTVNNKNKLLGASVGCMSCHQSENLQADQSPKKTQAQLHKRKQIQKA